MPPHASLVAPRLPCLLASSLPCSLCLAPPLPPRPAPPLLHPPRLPCLLCFLLRASPSSSQRLLCLLCFLLRASPAPSVPRLLCLLAEIDRILESMNAESAPSLPPPPPLAPVAPPQPPTEQLQEAAVAVADNVVAVLDSGKRSQGVEAIEEGAEEGVAWQFREWRRRNLYCQNSAAFSKSSSRLHHPNPSLR